jgi:hypothetical protein
MTGEVVYSVKKNCVFVQEWKCPIETEEIPLEVCKLCLEARRLQSMQLKISRQVEAAELSPAAKAETEVEAEVPQVLF